MNSTNTWRALARAAAGLLLAGYMAVAPAAPDDDYRAGEKAYHGGDLVQAMASLRKSADAGHAPSQALLASILGQAEFNDEAFAYYRKAALQGNAEGEFGVGTMYAAGEGVKRDNPAALKWITSAAQKGHVLATKVLAQAYMKGELGLSEAERSGPNTLHWVRRAVELDYVPAIDFLARAYRGGTLGLEADVRQAEALEKKARLVQGIAENTKAAKKARR